MVTDTKDRNIDTTTKTGNDSAKGNDSGNRLPHERDASPDPSGKPRDDMRQAASDLERGLVDTDLHGERGVEKVAPAAPKSAQPVAPPPAKHGGDNQS